MTFSLDLGTSLVLVIAISDRMRIGMEGAESGCYPDQIAVFKQLQWRKGESC